MLVSKKCMIPYQWELSYAPGGKRGRKLRAREVMLNRGQDSGTEKAQDQIGLDAGYDFSF